MRRPEPPLPTSVNDVLAEQSAKWPDGPLAEILPPEVRADPAIPPELVRLWEDIKRGKVTDFEAAQALGKLRTKFVQPGLLAP